MKNLLIGFFPVASVCASAQQVAKGLTGSNGVFIGFYEYKPTNYNASPTTQYPLIIFMHGMGERGNGTTELSRVTANAIPRYIKDGDPMTFTWNGKTETFLVLSPQLSNNYGWWEPFYTDEMIKYAKANLRIDTNRIILTGLSLGGGGVWTYTAPDPGNSQKFAAITPVCPTCQSYPWSNIGNVPLPLWAFHALDDGTTPASCTGAAINAISSSAGNTVKPYFTTWPTGGHGIWDRAYDRTYNYQNPNVYEWWLGQNKSLPVNKRPTANAGNNITVSSTPGSATLSAAGSTDQDGDLVRFIWKKLSGPAGGGVTAATAVTTDGRATLTALTPGIYRFEVKAVDDRADYSLDTVSVTVINGATTNIPPVSNAGSDLSTEYPSVGLNGSNSYDPDGTITNYSWTKITGPPVFTLSSTTAVSPLLDNMLLGDYAFELRTTDNLGAIARDTVVIHSNGMPLGVNLRYFKASDLAGSVQLNWATEREVGNDHFEIERSDDGTNFVSIGSIQGQQRSTALKEYSLTDERPVFGTVYYRIRQFSVDGKSSYLQTVTISGKSLPGGIHYFPNPVRGSFTIQVKEKQAGLMKINLYSLDGRLIKQKQIIKKDEHISTAMDVTDVSRGVYMLEVVIDDKLRQVMKLVKQ
jgi:predicted peptidase